MKKNWFIWKSEREFKILHEHDLQGRKFIITFLVVICTCWFEFLLEPLCPLIMDIIMPLNQSRSRKFNPVVEYFVNQDDHYFWITLHTCHTNTVMITIIFSTDAIFLAFLYHACGVFATLGYKLKNIGIKNCNERNKMREIKFCAEVHDSLLSFVTRISKCFSTLYFIVVWCTIILIITFGVQLMTHLEQLKIENVHLRLIFGHLFHVFCINYSCQRLTDHSFQLFRNM
ncbi:uncharacterized protein LOC122503510 [Leptopilina heterotoma]|uniref:uncharacterized protein LOC122503510 n=1 Tax=Leptopilina heterotoma TaxID=63436 RepID=UPI001CA995C9|nr:uncharacterized protein LOC122503510 [Leptopilina heterotoma]